MGLEVRANLCRSVRIDDMCVAIFVLPVDVWRRTEVEWEHVPRDDNVVESELISETWPGESVNVRRVRER